MVLGEVVVRGVLICRGARLVPATDGWVFFGQGATLGLALQGLAMLAGRALGAPWLPAAEGLAWLRAHASRDAVVWADNPSLLLSAFGELRLYHENGLYSPRARRVGPSREPWPERVALQQRLLSRPDAAAVAEARRAMGPGPRLLLVADAVRPRIEAGFVVASVGAVRSHLLFPGDLFTRRFRNGALHVYEAREGDPHR